MTSTIAAVLHQPLADVMAWDWREIVERHDDALAIEKRNARFTAAVMGAKLREE